jgi:hypothetical protein
MLKTLFRRLSLFLDTGTLTAPLTLEIQLGATHSADLVHFDGLDIRGEKGESPFYTYAIGDLPYGKGRSMPFALALEDVAFKALDTLLVAFNDLIVDGDIITGFELRKLFFSRQLLVYKSYSSVHNFKFCDAERVFFKDGKGSNIPGKIKTFFPAYLATFTARFSRMTVTLIWPG